MPEKTPGATPPFFFIKNDPLGSWRRTYPIPTSGKISRDVDGKKAWDETLSSIVDTTVINGKTFTSSYNPTLSLWTRTSPLGRVHLTKVDEQGRIVFDRFAGLQPVGFTYDANGRLSAVTQGTWPEQRVFIIAYNCQFPDNGPP
jgi:YD repeat-containing protein